MRRSRTREIDLETGTNTQTTNKKFWKSDRTNPTLIKWAKAIVLVMSIYLWLHVIIKHIFAEVGVNRNQTLKII